MSSAPQAPPRLRPRVPHAVERCRVHRGGDRRSSGRSGQGHGLVAPAATRVGGHELKVRCHRAAEQKSCVPDRRPGPVATASPASTAVSGGTRTRRVGVGQARPLRTRRPRRTARRTAPARPQNRARPAPRASPSRPSGLVPPSGHEPKGPTGTPWRCTARGLPHVLTRPLRVWAASPADAGLQDEPPSPVPPGSARRAHSPRRRAGPPGPDRRLRCPWTRGSSVTS